MVLKPLVTFQCGEEVIDDVQWRPSAGFHVARYMDIGVPLRVLHRIIHSWTGAYVVE